MTLGPGARHRRVRTERKGVLPYLDYLAYQVTDVAVARGFWSPTTHSFAGTAGDRRGRVCGGTSGLEAQMAAPVQRCGPQPGCMRPLVALPQTPDG
jgi:hypothetical protein